MGMCPDNENACEACKAMHAEARAKTTTDDDRRKYGTALAMGANRSERRALGIRKRTRKRGW